MSEYEFKDQIENKSYAELLEMENVLANKILVQSVLGTGSSITNTKITGELEVVAGVLKSSNYVAGTSGWQLTPTSGEINFAISVDSLDIPDLVTANSFHVDNTGNAWWGATVIGGAIAKILNTGVATFTNVIATGTINATGGYVGSATALVYEATGMNCGVTGHMRGGQTDYNTGTGWFIGYTGLTYKLSIGDGTLANSLLWTGTDLYVKGSLMAFQNIFGDGADGDKTIAADTVLTEDKFYDNLTINAGKTLYPAGYRIFVKGTLTNNGTISRNGNDGGAGADGALEGDGGVGGTAGTILTSGSLYGALAGEPGSLGGTGVNTGDMGTKSGATSHAGVDLAKALGSDGVAGGDGGAGGQRVGGGGGVGPGDGAIGGIAGVKTGTVYNYPRNIISGYMLFDSLPTGDAIKSNPSAGGGGGGGGGSNQTGDAGHWGGGGGGGGGTGSGGGIVAIFARTLINNTLISANGGNGGDGGDGGDGYSGTVKSGNGGGGGGGCGGNGGVIILCYTNKSGAGTVTVTGGTAGVKGVHGTIGNGGVDGTDGIAGTTGKIFEFVV